MAASDPSSATALVPRNWRGQYDVPLTALAVEVLAVARAAAEDRLMIQHGSVACWHTHWRSAFAAMVHQAGSLYAMAAVVHKAFVVVAETYIPYAAEPFAYAFAAVVVAAGHIVVAALSVAAAQISRSCFALGHQVMQCYIP